MLSANSRLTSCAALLCRACLDEITCVAVMYLALRTGCSRGRTPKVVRPQQRKNPLPFPHFAAVTCRQSVPDPPRERGDSQEGGNLGVYPLVRPPRRQEPFAYPAKNSRPLETNTLTQFVSPSHPVPRKAAQNSRCAGTAKNTKKQPPEGDCLHFGFTLRYS